MTEQQFRYEMARAKTMQENEPSRAAYWRGYQRGLRRAYHGTAFGTEEEHNAYMQAINSDYTDRRELGQGYHDGLQKGEKND